MRAANSSARSPANTRWPWESTKPGISARPSASIRSPLVALGDLRPDPGDLAGLEQDRGVAQRPQLGVVGDERADVGDQHPTMVPMTSAAVAANTIDSSIVCGFGGLQARRGEVERDQVGAEAGRDPAGVVPAQAGVVRGGLEQGARREVAAALGLQPQVELHRARLLEQVDDRVAVAAEREPRTRVADAVGEVALGRRAHADRGLAQVVVRVQVRGVDRGASPARARRARPAAARACGPCAARQASFSARCSETWKCSGLPRANSTTVASWSGGTARTEWIAAPTFAPLIAATRSAHVAASPSLKPRWAWFGGSPNPPAR